MLRHHCIQCKNWFKRYGRTREYKFCSQKCFNDFRAARTTNQDFFCNLKTPEQAYWLGFIYADGSITKPDRKQKSLTIALAWKDHEHLRKFAKIFGANVHKYKKDNGFCAQCRITCKQIWESLISLGIKSRKKYHQIDSVWENVPDSLISHFVRGIFDGDGCISYNRKIHSNFSVSFTGSDMLLRKIAKWISNQCEVSLPTPFKRKNANVYALGWSGRNQVTRIGEVLYGDATIFLSRKKDRFDKLTLTHTARNI